MWYVVVYAMLSAANIYSLSATANSVSRLVCVFSGDVL